MDAEVRSAVRYMVSTGDFSGFIACLTPIQVFDLIDQLITRKADMTSSAWDKYLKIRQRCICFTELNLCPSCYEAREDFWKIADPRKERPRVT